MGSGMPSAAVRSALLRVLGLDRYGHYDAAYISRLVIKLKGFTGGGIRDLEELAHAPAALQTHAPNWEKARDDVLGPEAYPRRDHQNHDKAQQNSGDAASGARRD
jgi:hypothetical protein